jgi:succinoglycan biosynthesis protein ExoM
METRRADSSFPSCTPDASRLAPDATTREAKHICVCICTYKRPEFLRRLLRDLGTQETDGRFTYSIVVADNDVLRSAEAVVSNFAGASAIPVTYCVEPRQNIALARNHAISRASGDYIAFIDDDEFPIRSWLLSLFTACNEYGVDGVLGPVKRHFDETPPKWIVKGNFYERVIRRTGTVLDREGGLTGNVLLRRRILDGQKQPFKPEFRGGEDKEFFRRMINDGYKFIWSAEAVAYEVVPPIRWKRSFMLRRALFRGSNVHLHPTFGPRHVLKSLIAVPTYAVALPLALLLGQDRFMDLLVRLFDHLGLLLRLVGINPVREQYIVE